jgi:hypothetical protein
LRFAEPPGRPIYNRNFAHPHRRKHGFITLPDSILDNQHALSFSVILNLFQDLVPPQVAIHRTAWEADFQSQLQNIHKNIALTHELS